MTTSLKQYLFWALVVLVTSVGLAPAADPVWSMGTPIVTYFAGPGGGGNPPQHDATASQLAEGGWNLVWTKTLAELNVAQAHGLRAMWIGSLNDPTVNSVRNHPALYAYYLIDEPSATQFASLASTVSRLRTLDPNHMSYINLFPNYASSAQLGTSDYPTYLSQYMSIVNPSLLSYDHYHFRTGGSDAPDYFKNLAIISHTARDAGIPFMNIVQAASWNSSMRVPTGDELRYLYYTSLAYGAQGISQYVYYYPGHTGMMTLADGTTTALYDTAKTINPEFAAIAEQVQSMNHIGAYHLGDLPPGYAGSSPMRLPGNSPFTLSSAIPDTSYVTYQPVRGAVLGLFGPDDQLTNATGTLVVNLDYSNALNTRVMGPGDLSIYDPATDTWIAQNHSWADVSLLPGGGVLVGLTSEIPEPATMSLLGLGGLALLRRRRK